MPVITRDSHAHGFEMREYIADGGIYIGALFYEHTIVHGTSLTSVKAISTTSQVAKVVYVMDSNGGIDLSWRWYIYFDSLPTTDETLSNIQAVIGDLGHAFGNAFNSATGKIRSFVKDSGGYHYGSDADLVVSTGAWYRLEVAINGDIGVNGPVLHSRTSIAPMSTEVEVFGGQSPDCIDEPSGFTNFELHIGPYQNPGSAFTVYIDDIVAQYGGPGGSPDPGYPLGPGETYTMVPQSTGTTVSPEKFTDSAGNTPPVNPHLFVDDVNGLGDYFYQNANDAAAYIDLNFGGMPTTSWVYGINAHLNHAMSAAASGTMSNWLTNPDTGNTRSIGENHASSHTSEETFFANELVFWLFPGNFPPDSAAKINSLFHTHGKSTDTSPFTRLHRVVYEIAYRAGAAAPSGGGVEHERRPFPLTQAAWRVHPWTMREHDGRR